MNRIKIRNNEKGFTLIEIIIVVIILSLIAALVGPRLFKKVEKSKQQITRTQIVMIENSVKMFKLDTGRYPTTEEGLKILMENTGGIPIGMALIWRRGCPRTRGVRIMFTRIRARITRLR